MGDGFSRGPLPWMGIASDPVTVLRAALQGRTEQDLFTLAGMIGVIPSIMRRWQTGESKPHPMVAKAVLELIRRIDRE